MILDSDIDFGTWLESLDPVKVVEEYCRSMGNSLSVGEKYRLAWLRNESHRAAHEKRKDAKNRADAEAFNQEA